MYGKLLFAYQPFYIGKGTGRRCQSHIAEAYRKVGTRGFKCSKIRRIIDSGKKVLIGKVATRLTEDAALSVEKELISKIGRASLGGPLTNFGDGGTANAGRVFSEEHRKRLSASKKGRPVSEARKQIQSDRWKAKTLEEQRAILDKCRASRQARSPEAQKTLQESKSATTKEAWARRSPEQRARMLHAARAAMDTLETKAKIRAQNLRRNSESAKCPHCGKKGQSIALKRWHFDNCKLKE